MPYRWGKCVVGWLAVASLGLVGVVVGNSPTTWGQEAAPEVKRVAIPKAADQDAARKLLLDLFRADFEQAKKPEEKLPLAEKMLQVGNDTHDDAAGQYMLYQIAKETAMAALNAELALRVIEAQGTYFEIDAPVAKLDTVTAIEKTLKTSKDRQALQAALEALIDEQLQADQYELAKKTTALSLDLARKVPDPNGIKQAGVKLKDIETREKLFGEVRAARKVLETKPDDPAANTTVGRFLCLINGDWEAGLPLLAKSGDAKLKAAAEKELTEPQESNPQMEAADAWWDAAEKETGAIQQALQQRAVAWYELAMPGLSGLAKLKVSGRLDKVAKATAMASKTAGKSGLKGGIGPTPKLMTNSLGMKLVLIPAGTFVMGSPPGEQGRGDDETQHRVTLTKGFYMGATEVTVKQWVALMNSLPRTVNPNTTLSDNSPVGSLTWNEATEFCRRLSAKEGKNYRLPTEAEWEYACRAGSTGRFCFGDDDSQLINYGWIRESFALPTDSSRKEVGQKKPNVWGLYDMHGGIREFCSDYYEAYPEGDATDPQGGSGSRRVYRGGSYSTLPYDARCAKRGSSSSENASSSMYGFRVVLDTAAAAGTRQAKPGTMSSGGVSSGGSPGSKPSIPVSSNPPRMSGSSAFGSQSPRTTTNSIGMKLNLIPAGTFIMGSPEDETERDPEETQHKVTISKPFYMGVTEVTQAQWSAVMDHKPFDPPQKNSRLPVGANYPVGYLTWDDAVDFCRKLSAKEGRTYRLPTEAEWEYACRAGTTTRFYFGDDEKQLNDFAWYRKSLSTANDYADYHIQPVGLKRPNAAGLFDMAGNVCEFCSDWLGPYATDAQTDPQGADSGTSRVVRSCHYNDFVKDCRSAKRAKIFSGARSSVLGLRVVLEVGTPAAPSAPKPASSPTGMSAPKPPTAVASNQPRSPVGPAPGTKQLKSMTNSIGMKLVEIPAGTFMMGSPPEEKGHTDDETQHTVKITKSFFMGVTEVTQSQWKAVMDHAPWEKYPEENRVGENYAAHHLLWDEAVEFCAKLSAKEGKTYRLPTEAEWEYACRAGTTTRFFFGDDERKSNDYMRAGSEPPIVGQKMPNPFGLYDMYGNVREWCSDRIGPYSAKFQTDPQGPNSGIGHVRRFQSSAKRELSHNTFHDKYNGFRVVCEVSTPAAPNAPKPASSPTDMSAPKPPTAMASNQPRSTVAQPPGAKQPKTITNTIGMKLVEIPAGTFMMGSPENEQGRSNDRETQHRVTLTKPFYIGATEVTQGQWAAVMGTQPWQGKPNSPEGENYPANWVSWEDVNEYGRKLSAKEGKTYRLPTEAEWEYACRAGSTRAFCCGDDRKQLENFAWYISSINGERQMRRVGQKQPNAAGLYDMHGNLFEMVADWFAPYSSEEATDPQGPSSGTDYVTRGGSYKLSSDSCRSANRSYNSSKRSSGYDSYGFRVVCEP